MRPTRSGVVVLASGPLLVLLAWLFGQPELTVAAAMLVATFVGCAGFVLVRRPRLEVDRRIRPQRVTVGGSCSVRLDITNTGPSKSAVIGLRDVVDGRGQASVHLAPLEAGSRHEVDYRVPTDRRGLHFIGPLTAEVEDPFGLLKWIRRIGDTGTVVVVPRTHPLDPMPALSGDEPVHGSRTLAANATVEEEFAALRPYTVGDDIRRIHWRTTARVGRLVVRQYEDRWHRRTTVLLDVDASFTDDVAFERAVTVAASVVQAAADDAGIVRLLTSDGTDSGFVSAQDHAARLMDRLAVVEPVAPTSLATGLRMLERRPTGRLVTVLGRLDVATWHGWNDATLGDGVRIIVTTTPADAASDGVVDAGPAGRDTFVVRWDGSRPLDSVWTTAMTPSSQRTARRATAVR